MKLPATLIALAIALSAVAQSTQTPAPATIKIKAKGDDIRTVIDSIFEQSGKQYVLETNVHQAMYMNLEGTFQKAIEIVSNVGAIEFEEKQGVWYVHTRAKQNPNYASGVAGATGNTAPNTFKPITKAPAKTSKAPAKIKTALTKPKVKTAAKPAPKSDTSTATVGEVMTAGQSFATISPATKTAKAASTLDLTKRLTVQLKKMDIREVFDEFSRQTNIDIEIDESVPSYKLDAYFYNTSLKFALDKICKVANLKYTTTLSKTLRISKL